MGQYNHLANSFLPDEREAGSVGEQREPATCSGSLLDAGGEIILMFVYIFVERLVLYLSLLSSAACLSLTLVLFLLSISTMMSLLRRCLRRP